ncbi:hypothetical protein KL86DES1_20607 [uncultured Desulfovibrio sp.]|uniref:Uncharacterized protein n=1 Tax=uncultured Desulfovibrio sp. TaxID=167968 RepID=A0A212L512_9BACT|nr:hypothetical protein KL86DES1_20607 [uncultured Desulfovibrio sp.]VZH33510.1 conserved protein of unknown function [Desulfovibrio sp. 86]
MSVGRRLCMLEIDFCTNPIRLDAQGALSVNSWICGGCPHRLHIVPIERLRGERGQSR